MCVDSFGCMFGEYANADVTPYACTSKYFFPNFEDKDLLLFFEQILILFSL